MSTTKPITTEPVRSEQSFLWLIVVAAFVVQLAAWTAWFVIASHHRVAEVPVATQGNR